MKNLEDRVTELEIRYTHQSQLLDDVNSELVRANQEIERMQRHIKRIENLAGDMLNREAMPPNEKPPHY